ANPAVVDAGSGSLLEDPFVKSEVREGLDLLYNLKFEQADRHFERIAQRFPGHPIGPFLKAMNTWWHILLDLSDESHDEAFYDEMKEVIDRCDRILAHDRHNVDAMFFKGLALGLAGRLRSNRGQWLRAALDGKRAMDYVYAVAKQKPDNDDLVFAAGIYDYFADVIRDKYPAARPLMVFFPNGNRERGLLELQRTAEKGVYLQTEAVYFLLQIFYIFEGNQQKSLEYVNWLRQKYPDNAYFEAMEGRIHARWGDWAGSEAIFQDILHRYGEPGYNNAAAEQAFYYIARAKAAYGRSDEALQYLDQLIRLTARREEDTYFEVWGRVRQGMAYDALGQREQAVATYEVVLDMKDFGNAHEWAERYLDKPYGM
ncbi:MAG TPA: tetratricopeptide repeat protein, partial [Rhodothermales bacterium]|nr:tetratricopeptide repeat protein [Rhodothermales bacterium]